MFKETLLNCLELAEELHIRSVSTPAVGSNLTGIRLEFASLFIGVLQQHFKANPLSSIEEIKFVEPKIKIIIPNQLQLLKAALEDHADFAVLEDNAGKNINVEGTKCRQFSF